MSWLQQVFNIKDGTDYTQTAITISDGIKVKGLNVWLMICSALLASIGLDTNSTAVIIGAMLISPLMSPILGAGYSLGVHDKELFVRSVNNLVYITVFSLLTSVFYFLLTPLGEPTSEILSRTHPTLLDIGVAFFGGVAGIVSASRSEKINALPGVAIATALMPPLCAAGFGLATGRWEIFGGAFYLFFINAVFIALATFLIVKLLGFPVKSYIDKVKQKRVARLAFLILILISIPSFLFLYIVYEKNKTRQLIQAEVINDFHNNGNEILKWEIEDLDSVKLVKTFFSGHAVSDTTALFYNDKLKQAGLDKYRARFFRINISKAEVEKLSTQMTEAIMKNIEVQNKIKDSMQPLFANVSDGGLYHEVKSLYPNVSAFGVSQTEVVSAGKKDTIWSGWLQWDTLSGRINKTQAAETVVRFLKARLKTDTVWLQQTLQQKATR